MGPIRPNKTGKCCFYRLSARKTTGQRPGVSALVAHPGLAETDLQSTTVRDGGMGEWFTKQLMKMGQSREDGALGILTCIAHPDALSGQFFGPGMGGMFTALKGPATGHPLETCDNPKTQRFCGRIAAPPSGKNLTSKNHRNYCSTFNQNKRRYFRNLSIVNLSREGTEEISIFNTFATARIGNAWRNSTHFVRLVGT